MHSTFVTKLIKFRIAKDRKIITSPIKAYVKTSRAPFIFSWSPPDLIYLTPDRIIKNKATTPAKIRAQFTTFLNNIGTQFKVATPLSRHPSHSIEIE